jgi:hypothetical protein
MQKMQPTLTNSLRILVLLAVVGATSLAAAQERLEPSAAADEPQVQANKQPEAGASAEMREMAKSMKSMAEMCQTMMQMEMQHRPVLIAAGAALGTLLSVALVLFVVLEVQWIRFWGLRIRNERRALG